MGRRGGGVREKRRRRGGNNGTVGGTIFNLQKDGRGEGGEEKEV